MRVRDSEGRLRRSCKQRGIEAFRADVAAIAPFLHDRVDELRDWDDVKLLTVRSIGCGSWYRPGLLCIGDAAHAMSPVGGVGINLAIQDAVAAANILAGPLAARHVQRCDLARCSSGESCRRGSCNARR